MTPDLTGSLTAGPVVATPRPDGTFTVGFGGGRRMMRVAVESIPSGS
jgi:hypothetical protein